MQQPGAPWRHCNILRRGLAVASAVLLGVGGVAAQPVQMLENLGCFAPPESYETSLRNERLLALMSGWSGQAVAALAGADANVSSGRLADAAPAISAAHPDLIARMEADIAGLGVAICPAARLAASVPLHNLVPDQGEFQSFYHPVVRGAQRLAHLHGCGPEDFDGAFGPNSRAAHARLLTAFSGVTVDDATIGAPSPAGLTRLARAAVSVGLCDARWGGAGIVQSDAPALAPLRLLDPQLKHDGNRMSWLAVADADLSLLVEGAGAAIGAAQDAGSAPPDYHKRLMLWLAEQITRESPERLLSEVHARGIRVRPDARAAGYWRAQARATAPAADRFWPQMDRLDRLHLAFQEGTANGADAAAVRGAVRALLTELSSSPWGDEQRFGGLPEWEMSDGPFADPETGADIPGWLLATQSYPIRPTATSMSLKDIAPLAWLARLVAEHPEAEAVLLDEAAPEAISWVAWQVHEGAQGSAADDAKAAAVAARLLAVAADRDEPFAASRLAFMALHGRGVERDPVRALELATFAASRNDPFAAHILALMQDAEAAGQPGTERAVADAYLRAVTRDGQIWLPLVPSVANRLTDPQSVLSTPSGGQALRDAVRAAGAMRMAEALAEVALCAHCGGAVVPEEAAEWLRLADDLAQDALAANDVRLDPETGELTGESGNPEFSDDITRPARMLYRLLALHPEVALDPDEGPRRLRRVAATGSVPGFGAVAESWFAAGLLLKLDGADVAAAEDLLVAVCEANDRGCTAAARRMATGEFGTPAVGPGIRGLLDSDDVALVDLLAAFGDFEGALAAARRHGRGNPGGLISEFELAELGNQREATLRRLFSGRAADDLETLPPALEPFLAFMAASGDTAASRYLRMIPRSQSASALLATLVDGHGPRDPAQALAAYQAQAERGALSGALTQAARDAAVAAAGMGDTEQAIQFELVALRGELDLAELSGLADGPLWATLSASCHLARTSERVLDLGADELALVLAKDAVNRLQALRRDLAGLPENLQACFRDLVADNYRWLAGLFIGQERYDEAEHVIAMLKDFETFQFVDRDRDFAGRGFGALPMGQAEADLRDGIAALSLPIGPAAREANELRQRRAAVGLTRAETDRLAELDAELSDAARAFDVALRDLGTAAQSLDRAEVTAQLRGLGPVQGHLRHGADARAVALHFVVLPDRLGVILTTPDLRIGHTTAEWEGAPFTEARLDDEIAAFHALLATPDRDPRPAAQRLTELLIGPLEHEIAAVDPELVLLSLDRRLRYLPFAALHDGDTFLAERFALAVLSDTPYELGGRYEPAVRVAGLGASNAAQGFTALPGVDIEIAGLVRGIDGFGLFDGRSWMNAEFDAVALEDALRIGGFDGLGMVHVASHFHLGQTEADSFLLLGTGERLDLAALRDNPLAYDFGGVGLLTLSACSTGFADPAQDGRELESLASITGNRGARSVLASLWPVQDNTTSILMQRFYELQDRGDHSRAQALALVQREFIQGTIGSADHLPGGSIVLAAAERGGVALSRNHEGHELGIGHPFYWAPFVLTGNWR